MKATSLLLLTTLSILNSAEPQSSKLVQFRKNFTVTEGYPTEWNNKSFKEMFDLLPQQATTPKGLSQWMNAIYVCFEDKRFKNGVNLSRSIL